MVKKELILVSMEGGAFIKLRLTSFLLLHYVTCFLMFVNKFKYLGHVIDNSFSDDSDINREIKALFTRTNVLCRRFSRCSLTVKVRLFRTYCICFYHTALWSNFTIGTFNRFSSCYFKCIKCFFSDTQSIAALQKCYLILDSPVLAL